MCAAESPACKRMAHNDTGSTEAKTGLCECWWSSPAPLLWDTDNGPRTTIFFVVRGLLKLVLIISLKRFLKRNEKAAAAGDTKAAQHTIYEIYKKPVDIFLCVFAAAAVLSLVIPYPMTWEWPRDANDDAKQAQIEFTLCTCVWCIIVGAESAVEQGLMVFLAHKSVGQNALRHAHLAAAVWLFLIFIVFACGVGSSFSIARNRLPTVTAAVQLAEGIFAAAILLSPVLRHWWQSRVGPVNVGDGALRPAAFAYAWWSVITSLLLSVSGSFLMVPASWRYCAEMFLQIVDSFSCVWMYAVVRSDTRHWSAVQYQGPGSSQPTANLRFREYCLQHCLRRVAAQASGHVSEDSKVWEDEEGNLRERLRESGSIKVDSQVAGDENRSTARPLESPLLGRARSASLQMISALTSPRDNTSISGSNSHAAVKLNRKVPTVDFSRVQLGNLLAAGMAGKVYVGAVTLRAKGPLRNRGETVQVAVKCYYCDELTEDVIRSFRTEANFLGSLRHRNIVGVVGVCVRPPDLCLLLEYCPLGSLWDVLQRETIDERQDGLRKLHFALDCAIAVDFLHGNNIAHCDIKSKNFLVAEDHTASISSDHSGSRYIVKLADLGDAQTDVVEGAVRKMISKRLRKSDASRHSTQVGGTPEWMAPELLARAVCPTGQLHSMIPGLREKIMYWQNKTVEERQRNSSSAHSQNIAAVHTSATGNWTLELSTLDLRRGDMFSLGVVLWEIVTASSPLSDRNIKSRLQLVRAVCVDGYRPTLPSSRFGGAFEPGKTTASVMDPRRRYEELLSQCWKEAAERPTSSHVVHELQNLRQRVATGAPDCSFNFLQSLDINPIARTSFRDLPELPTLPVDQKSSTPTAFDAFEKLTLSDKHIAGQANT